MILGMGPAELIIIVVIVLIIFGPKNLPKLGKSLGKTVKNIREGMDGVGENGEPKSKDVTDTVEEETASEADAEPTDAPTGSVVFCSKCGTQNASDAEFCSKCGAKLTHEA